MNKDTANQQERDQEIKNLSQETLVKYRNLGGWLLAYLILTGIGLFQSVMKMMVLLTETTDLFSQSGIAGMSDSDIAMLELQFSLGVLFFFLNAICLVIHIVFTYRRNFKFSILSIIGSCVFAILQIITFALIGADGTAVMMKFAELIFGALFTFCYFFFSLRVRVYFSSAEQYEKWYRKAPYLVTPPADENEDADNVVKDSDDLDSDT